MMLREQGQLALDDPAGRYLPDLVGREVLESFNEADVAHSRSPGSYSWAGLYNTHFWADPKQGIATVLLMQVLPFYDDACIGLLTDVEQTIYRQLD